MNEACRPFREQLGAMALGHLSDEEATAVRAHLDGCAECRAELRTLEEVAAVLPLVDPGSLEEARVAPPPGLGDRVVSVVRRERAAAARRRRRTWGTGVAAAAALLAIALTAVVALPSGSGDVRVTLEPETGDAAPIAAVLTERAWGTEIRLDVEGLPAGEPFVVWLREPDDDRVPAGSFTATEAGGSVVLASSLALSAADGIGISDADGETMAYGHLPD
jgi:anti-sigma factor RsiW